MRSMKANRRSRERGFSLIELMIVIAIIGILVGIGVPAYQGMVRRANDASAVQSLNTLQVAQRTFHGSRGRGNYGTFDQLVADGILDETFAGETPVISGYVFTMRTTPKSTNEPASYIINADPQRAGGMTATGSFHFYMDSNSNTIRYNAENQASAQDPPYSQ